MKIIRKEEQKTSLWSGGKTTELYIYPPESNFSDRNFEVRISTATVETETSVFTTLPGYKRQLMILEGKLTIQHNQEKKMLLLPFQKHQFMGHWETKAEGKVVDFNLMTSKNWNGEIQVIQLPENEQLIEKIDAGTIQLYYILNGSFIISKEILNTKDIIVFYKSTEAKLIGKEECKFLSIKLKENK